MLFCIAPWYQASQRASGYRTVFQVLHGFVHAHVLLSHQLSHSVCCVPMPCCSQPIPISSRTLAHLGI